jgi:hypothetical protein
METAAATDPMPPNCGKSINDSAESAWPASRPRLLPRTTLRCDDRTVADTLWALTLDASLRLVHEARWPIEKDQTWLADLLQRLFLP